LQLKTHGAKGRTSLQNGVQDSLVIADARPAASLQPPCDVPGLIQTVGRQVQVEGLPHLQDEAVCQLLDLSEAG